MSHVLFQKVRLPISWRKCELSHSVVWIGWKFNFLSGLVSVSILHEKQQKLLALIDQLRSHQRVPLRSLQKFLGLAMWITQLFGQKRIWLHYLYMDIRSVPATQFSVGPGFWHHELVDCLSEDLRFTKRPPFTAMPVGAHLVRRKKVTTLADVRSALLSEIRVWLRIRDPTSARRISSQASQRILRLFQSWLEYLPTSKSIWPKPTWTGNAAADACAHDAEARIGGFINLPHGRWLWFAEKFHPKDFKDFDVEMNQLAQRDMVCDETLAQIAIVVFSEQMLSCVPIPYSNPQPVRQHRSRIRFQHPVQHEASDGILLGEVIIFIYSDFNRFGRFSYQWSSERTCGCGFEMGRIIPSHVILCWQIESGSPFTIFGMSNLKFRCIQLMRISLGDSPVKSTC